MIKKWTRLVLIVEMSAVIILFMAVIAIELDISRPPKQALILIAGSFAIYFVIGVIGLITSIMSSIRTSFHENKRVFFDSLLTIAIAIGMFFIMFFNGVFTA